MSFFDLRCIIFNIIFFGKYVFSGLLLNVWIALDVGSGLVLWLLAFTWTLLALFLSDFFDLLFDAIWALLVKFVYMSVGLALLLFGLVFWWSAAIEMLWNLAFALCVKLIVGTEEPRDAFRQIVITVTFQASYVHCLPEGVIYSGCLLPRYIVGLIQLIAPETGSGVVAKSLPDTGNAIG